MKEDYANGTLDKFRMLSILMDQKVPKRKYVIKENLMEKYFPEEMKDQNELEGGKP